MCVCVCVCVSPVACCCLRICVWVGALVGVIRTQRPVAGAADPACALCTPGRRRPGPHPGLCPNADQSQPKERSLVRHTPMAAACTSGREWPQGHGGVVVTTVWVYPMEPLLFERARSGRLGPLSSLAARPGRALQVLPSRLLSLPPRTGLS